MKFLQGQFGTEPYTFACVSVCIEPRAGHLDRNRSCTSGNAHGPKHADTKANASALSLMADDLNQVSD